MVNGKQSEIVSRRKNRKDNLKRWSKKFGMRGKFGLGTSLNEDRYHYFIRVWDVNRSEQFQTNEERAMFASNVLEETKGKEIEYSSNQLASRVIESLLQWASDSMLSHYLEVFGEDLRPIFSDPFASHVLQKLIEIAAAKRVSATKESGCEVDSKCNCSKWFLKVAKYALNNLEEFLWDTYANHVVRTVLECLAGLPPHSTFNPKEIPVSVAVKKNYKKLLMEFGDRIMSGYLTSDIAFIDLTSAFLQTLLLALRVKNKKMTYSLVRMMLDKCFTVAEEASASTESQVLPLFTSPAASRVLEVCIMVASNKLRKQIHAQCFRHKMLQLSELPNGNYSVQKLLSSCMDEEEFNEMYDELGPHLGKLLQCGKTGVVLSLGQACHRLSTKQDDFMLHLMEALQCNNQQDFTPRVLQLTQKEVGDYSTTIQLHGALLVQTMLQFHKPSKVKSSLLAMSPACLRDVFSNEKGCRIADVFMSSEHVGKKSRDKFIAALKDHYLVLACSKYGSRSMDAIWKAADLEQKLKIVKKLAEKAAILENNQYGYYIATNVGVKLFKHSKDEWKNAQSQAANTKRMFEDIISEKPSKIARLK